MQAVILAAGMGRRLLGSNDGLPKCMISVNGERLIDRIIRQLVSCAVKRFVVIVGYKASTLRAHLLSAFPDLEFIFVENELYESTNNIYSLSLAAGYLCADDSLILDSDVIVDGSVIQAAVSDSRPDLAVVAPYRPWMYGTMLTVGPDHNITSLISPDRFMAADAPFYFKTVNIYRFSREFSERWYLPCLSAYMEKVGPQAYYEQVLSAVLSLGTVEVAALDVGSARWYEIDSPEDLRVARVIFSSPEAACAMITGNYGGFWRFPGLLDFCYLVNPCFPPSALIESIKTALPELLVSYPSGLKPLTRLVAEAMHVDPSFVCPGNGASELIKVLMDRLPGRIAVLTPTFEEYINRSPGKFVEIPVSVEVPCRLSAIPALASGRFSAVVLQNPVNPTGHTFLRSDLLAMLEVWKNQGVILVVDESFIDFADDPSSLSLFTDDILQRFPNLVIVKSLSKCYGVPGMRLGVLATSCESMLTSVRSEVSIWNINSFAEYFYQTFSRYEDTYRESLGIFRCYRRSFFDALSSVSGVHPVPSQGNFILLRLNPVSTDVDVV
ncbi:MAG: aminotransferase class I/II-fold pyridoxal phosphate-dependent enzyme, partial [Paramuribaculum sp.]|nr:aminotransferase class I/II-fold pyridoxal phosphate-dependent enzyme [Paramuribaculum sp.]